MRCVVIALVLVTACSSPPGDRDAAAAVIDARTTDAAVVDAGADAASLPDLTVNAERTMIDLAIEQRSFAANSCELDPEQRCVDGEGDRKLLRFGVETPNLGTTDLTLGVPTGVDDGFVYSKCHDHYHLAGYADYALVDGDGNAVATGHEQGLCLLDSELFSIGDASVSASPQFTCGFQGLSRGWSGVYDARNSCQLIDVTGVPDGDYTLRISVNDDHSIDELDYANNKVDIAVSLGDPSLFTPTEPCVFVDPHASRGTHRECGWQSKGVFECTAGAVFRIGCAQACSGLGSCTGDPMLRVCETNRADGNCSDPAALARSDDACNSQCPRAANLVCPDNSKVEVFSAPYAVGELYTCNIELEYQ